MKRVLLIEDDPWLAESYRRVMTKNGFEVRVVADADVAMRGLEKGQCDVIVADIMLEGHTVFALLHELQSYDDTATIPVILCSSLSSDGLSEEKLHEYGVRRVLDKATLTPEQLVNVVGEVAL